MFRSLTFVPAMLCVAAIAAAQTPTPAYPADKPATNPPAVQQPATPPATPATPAAQPARPAESSMASTVTYTGCLKPGTTPGTWILDSAELARQMGASASAQPSTSSAVGTSGTTKSFTLNTKPGSDDLKGHANHKIEVTGTLSAAKAGQASAQVSPSGAGATATATATVTPARQDFAVESFKMVSATCP